MHSIHKHTLGCGVHEFTSLCRNANMVGTFSQAKNQKITAADRTRIQSNSPPARIDQFETGLSRLYGVATEPR